MAREAIERGPLEIVVVVHAVTLPVALDLLGEQASEIAAGRLVAAGPLEREEVEIELSSDGVATHEFHERLASHEANARHRGRLSQVRTDAREHDDPRIDGRNTAC